MAKSRARKACSSLYPEFGKGAIGGTASMKLKGPGVMRRGPSGRFVDAAAYDFVMRLPRTEGKSCTPKGNDRAISTL
jgi:hypothetical protein